jgi:dTDP-4-amino-4,6-dideoxygalactose transaminase
LRIFAEAGCAESAESSERGGRWWEWALSGPVKIPLLDLQAQDAAIGREVRTALEGVLQTQQFVLGVPVAAFEREMAEFCGAGDAVGVGSGSDALYLALNALGVGPGTAVITSAYSFVATATAIVRLGARPVFVDIDRGSFNVTPEGVAQAIERYRRGPGPERLVGILPVHLFGQSAAVGALLELAAAHGLFVVEDAAQAIGAAVEGGGARRAGALGDAGCLSFYPTKNLGGLGDGGMVLTSKPELAQRLRSLRVHGAVGGPYRHADLGLGSRLDGLQAAALSVKLRYVSQWNEARRRVASWYMDAFRQANVLAPAHPGVTVPARGDETHVFHQYVIRAPGHRDRLRAFLDDRGIGTQVYYPIPLHLQPCLQHLAYRPGDFPEAERASAETLALPMYPELARAAVDEVVGAVVQYYRSLR